MAVLVGFASASMALAGGGATGADIQVSGSASSGSPAAGAAFSYTFQVKNSGSDAASNVVFTDALPEGTGFMMVGTTELPAIDASVIQVFTHTRTRSRRRGGSASAPGSDR